MITTTTTTIIIIIIKTVQDHLYVLSTSRSTMGCEQ